MKKTTSVLNRKAGFDIEVEEKYEAGIILTGSEIKSVRAGRVQLSGSYVRLMRGKGGNLPEPRVIGLHLSMAGEPERSKELLLHSKEIEKIGQSLQAKGKVAVPLSLYIKGGWAKLLIGVGKGRKSYDKKRVLKERDEAKSQRRDLKNFRVS